MKIYRLITRNSYEREMFDRASLKLGLDKAVLQSMGSMGGKDSVSSVSKHFCLQGLDNSMLIPDFTSSDTSSVKSRIYMEVQNRGGLCTFQCVHLSLSST